MTAFRVFTTSVYNVVSSGKITPKGVSGLLKTPSSASVNGGLEDNNLLTYLLACLLTYLLTYLLTALSRVLLEKLTGFQLVKKFSAFYGTRKFIPLSTPVSSKWSLSLRLPHQNRGMHLSSPPYILHALSISFFSI